MTSSSKAQTVTSFDPERTAARLKGALKQAGVETPEDLAGVERGSKRGAKVDRAMRRARADIAMPIAEAERVGAALPDVRALLRAGWRLEKVDVPEGDEFIEASPAYVVRFDGNSPIERLRRAGVLEDFQLQAAGMIVAMYMQAVKQPKLTASYDVVTAQGGVAPRPWIDVHSDAWKGLKQAFDVLLREEAEVVMEVAIFETTIETLGRRRDLVRFQERRKAEAAIVQTLSCGLKRLAMHWGLVAGGPRDVAT